jgi:hypothetical protein
MTDKQTIEDIKRAVDMGLKVTLADSAAYTVIRSEARNVMTADDQYQYLIAFRHGTSESNYVGLHGVAGTKYEHQINMGGNWIVTGTLENTK